MEKQNVLGYANAYQYLCNKAGLFCAQISGKANTGIDGHVWNVIKLNNEYYYIDTTWMDNDNELEIFNYEDSKNDGHIEYLTNLYDDDEKIFTNTGNINWEKIKCLF